MRHKYYCQHCKKIKTRFQVARGTDGIRFYWHRCRECGTQVIGLKEALEYVDMFSPKKVVFNHMASECDYDFVNEHTPDFVQPAYDNLKVEW